MAESHPQAFKVPRKELSRLYRRPLPRPLFATGDRYLCWSTISLPTTTVFLHNNCLSPPCPCHSTSQRIIYQANPNQDVERHSRTQRRDVVPSIYCSVLQGGAAVEPMSYVQGLLRNVPSMCAVLCRSQRRPLAKSICCPSSRRHSLQVVAFGDEVCHHVLCCHGRADLQWPRLRGT